MDKLVYDKLYIGGEWVAPQSTDTIEPVSASTEELLGKVPHAGEADVDRAVTSARAAFDDPSGWAHWPASRRAEVMRRFAASLESRAEEMVRRISGQNGMPVAIGQQLEAVFPAMLLRYYADLAEGTEVEERRPGLLGGTTLVRREPIGVVGAIVPWNFPQSLAFFKIAPAMAAGCTVVMKPSPETVLDSYLMAEAAEEAGVPPGVLSIVPGGREIGAYIVEHPKVDKIGFTGSTVAGRAIAQRCGELLRPVTLELGGKSAAIVLEDADLASNVENLFSACLMNNGQTCYAGTRILAPRKRYDEVVDIFTQLASSLSVGDALDPATQIGPMATAKQRERVEGYIAKGKHEGARITTGGGRPNDLGKGWFVEPTILADVDNRTTVAQEEIFGPVLSVIPYDDVDGAVQLANEVDYGLGGSVFTGDPAKGLDVARRVQTGTIGINAYLPDPTAPFGGIKGSGMGRELGPEGLAAYHRIQSVYLDSSQ
ncbi:MULTISPECIES: aldehyde dehydrogenase [unclassified Saccharopolyspora]|uniref:aldehyde dehydrogenase n=1 Tax=Saccharopolyspora TaxID=1835 RepID=UPI00190BB977|nr:aldehyde dehydrogenase [Saccharopolyspora sp. HNM0986]MBK0870783.1 aldehyde dehydrogenase [Saccharopolyspora sp. HNM0986]